MEQTEIGTIIKKVRTERGLSISKLGRDSKTSKGLISDLESGNRNDLQVSTLGKLAEAMSTHASALLRQLEDARKA